MKKNLLSAVNKSVTLVLLLAVSAFSNSINPPPSNSITNIGEKVLKNARYEKALEPVPIEFSNLKIGTEEIGFYEPFNGNDDWLKDLTFTVKNTSNKTITHIMLELLLPDPKGEKPMAAVAPLFAYGSNTALPGVVPQGSLKPGETLFVTYHPKAYEMFKALCKELSVSGVDRAMLEIGRVMFDDDTMWSKGFLHRRSPSNKLRWDVVHPNKISQSIANPNKTKGYARGISTAFSKSARTKSLNFVENRVSVRTPESHLPNRSSAQQDPFCPTWYSHEEFEMCSFAPPPFMFCTIQSSFTTNIQTYANQQRWKNITVLRWCLIDFQFFIYCDWVWRPEGWDCDRTWV